LKNQNTNQENTKKEMRPLVVLSSKIGNQKSKIGEPVLKSTPFQG